MKKQSRARTPKEVLLAARWIVDNVGWCKRAMYVDKNGKNLSPPARFYERRLRARGSQEFMSNISRVCLLGSFELVVADEKLRASAREIMRCMMHPKWEYAFDYFNDAPSTRKANVLRLFDRAIATCEGT